MNIENYIESQYRELLSCSQINVEYSDLYKSFRNQKLREILMTLHHDLVGLFRTMNERLPTGEHEAHFWAEPSRDLIKRIEIIFSLVSSLKATPLAFQIDPYYLELLTRCRDFLSSSGGSSLPPNMAKVELYYTLPIFLPLSSITISHKQQDFTFDLKLIGSGSYAIYLIGLALAFNAGTNGGYQIAYICAIVGGIANSFLDTGIYPAVGEIIYKAPGVATMGIKFFIAIAQMILPFVLGATVATTAAGLTSYNTLFFGCGIIYIVLLVLVMLFPLPDADQKAAGEKEGLIASLKHTHFSIESVAMILIGFTCTGTFQLWLNCAQNFAKENVGWTDPSIMQTYYSAGTMLALIVTALLTRKIKDVRFILIYPVICLATLVVVLVGKSQPLMIAGAFLIGWAGAGGLLQIATSVCNMLFPKIKGTVTALVMIASSLCNYTILTAASKMQPSQVMVMNIVLTTIGVVLGLFVNLRYTSMVEQAQADN